MIGVYCRRFASSRKSSNYLFWLVSLFTIDVQRIEAHLQDIHSGEDWDKLCASTPYDFYGRHFDHPDSCANRVSICIILSWSSSVLASLPVPREYMGSLAYGISTIQVAKAMKLYPLFSGFIQISRIPHFSKSYEENCIMLTS